MSASAFAQPMSAAVSAAVSADRRPLTIRSDEWARIVEAGKALSASGTFTPKAGQMERLDRIVRTLRTATSGGVMRLPSHVTVFGEDEYVTELAAVGQTPEEIQWASAIVVLSYANKLMGYVLAVGPRHEHDCAECVFLGRMEDRDLYLHRGVEDTLIARHGAEGAYHSVEVWIYRSTRAANRFLVTAHDRAMDKGLISDPTVWR